MSAFHTRTDELLCLYSKKATIQRRMVSELREQRSPIPGGEGPNPTGFSDLPGGKLALAPVKASFCLGGQKTRLD